MRDQYSQELRRPMSKPRGVRLMRKDHNSERQEEEPSWHGKRGGKRFNGNKIKIDAGKIKPGFFRERQRDAENVSNSGPDKSTPGSVEANGDTLMAEPEETSATPPHSNAITKDSGTTTPESMHATIPYRSTSIESDMSSMMGIQSRMEDVTLLKDLPLDLGLDYISILERDIRAATTKEALQEAFQYAREVGLTEDVIGSTSRSIIPKVNSKTTMMKPSTIITPQASAESESEASSE